MPRFARPSRPGRTVRDTPTPPVPINRGTLWDVNKASWPVLNSVVAYPQAYVRGNDMATEKEIRSYIESVKEPPDFDRFWQGVFTELRSVPLDAELKRVPLRSTNKAKVYDVRYTSLGGLRIAGWYCVPAKGNSPFPTLIHFPGYQGEPSFDRHWAERGVAVLSVAVRGKLRSNDKFNPGYPGVLLHTG